MKTEFAWDCFALTAIRVVEHRAATTFWGGMGGWRVEPAPEGSSGWVSEPTQYPAQVKGHWKLFAAVKSFEVPSGTAWVHHTRTGFRTHPGDPGGRALNTPPPSSPPRCTPTKPGVSSHRRAAANPADGAASCLLGRGTSPASGHTVVVYFRYAAWSAVPEGCDHHRSGGSCRCGGGRPGGGGERVGVDDRCGPPGAQGPGGAGGCGGVGGGARRLHRR